MPKLSQDRLHEVRRLLHQYRQCRKKQRARQYWRDAIYQVLQDKRHLRQKFRQLTCLLLERHRKQQARQAQIKIRQQQEHQRCVVCLTYPTPYELKLQQVLHQNIHKLEPQYPTRSLYSTIRMFCCKQYVHVACVLQCMYTQYGRYNKHLWRCPHCRYLMIDSKDEDVIIIGHAPPVDSDDDDDIEHAHRIEPFNPLEDTVSDQTATIMFTDTGGETID